MKKLISVLLTIAMLFSNIALAAVTLSDLLEKGGNYAVNGEFDKAEATFEIALKMEPENIRVYEAIKHMCILKGDLEGALRALDTALEYAPGEGELYLEKAKILYQMGNTYDAEQALLYAEVCGEEPDDSFLELAVNAYYKSGEFEKAISAYENLSKDTADEILMQAYMSALILTGQKEKALSLGFSLPENTNSEIAEAIDGKKTISLEPVEFPDISSFPVHMSKNVYEQWKKAFPDAYLFNIPTEDAGNRIKFSGCTLESFVLSEAEITRRGTKTSISLTDVTKFIGISPSGDTYLYSFYAGFALNESLMLRNLYVLVKDDEATVIMLDIDQSGIANTDLLKSQIFNIFAQGGFGYDRSSAVWSKDGRYLINGSVNLLLCDTETGECTAVLSSNRVDIYACFDKTCENLFFVEAYRQKQETGYAAALKKYCIKTGETEILYTHEDPVTYRRGLYLSDNDMVISAIGWPASDYYGQVIYTKTAQGWTFEYTGSDVVHWSNYHYSDHSGIGIYECHTEADALGSFLSIGSDTQPTPGYDHLVFLPRDADEAFTLPVSQMTRRAEGVPRFYGVESVAMSPDGYYALVAVDRGSAMYVLDLRTLKFSEVFLPSEEFDATSLSSTSWLGNNTILINKTLFSLTID